MKTIFRICFFALITLITNDAVGQSYLGLKLGVKASVPTGFEDEEWVSPLPSVLLGLQFEEHLGRKILLQSGLNFNGRGFSIDLTLPGDSGDADIYVEERINYLDVPLVVKFQLGGDKLGFNFWTGGTFGYAISGKRTARVEIDSDEENINETKSETIDFGEEGYSRFIGGIILGTGVQFGLGDTKFFVDANFDLVRTTLSAEQGGNQFFGMELSAGVKVPLGKER